MKTEFVADCRLGGSGSEIYYLEKCHVDNYADVTVFSALLEPVRISRMLLAAFSDTMCQVLSPDGDEVDIFTEFDISELEAVANFLSEGLLPMDGLNNEALEKAFVGFGIDFHRLMRSGFSDFTVCDLNNPEEFNDPTLFQDHLPPVKPVKRKLKTKLGAKAPKVPRNSSEKKRAKKIKSEPCDDDDNVSDNGKDDNDVVNGIGDDNDCDEKKSTENEADKWYLNNEGNRYFTTDVVANEPPAVSQADYVLPKPFAEYRVPPGYHEETSDFKCCYEEFQDSNEYRDHLMEQHPMRHQCPVCRKITTLHKGKFRAHVYQCEYGRPAPADTRTYECIQCGVRRATLTKMHRHLRSQGPFHNNECPQCGECMPSHARFVEHVKARHFCRHLVCGTCPQSFASAKERWQHKRAVHAHAAKKNKCAKCGLTFQSAHFLCVHNSQQHSGGKEKVKHPCPHCAKLFFSDALNRHIQKVHCKIKCDKCGKMVPEVRKKIHDSIHHGDDSDKDFRCTLCGKGFLYYTNLHEHMNIHTGARPYICKYCGKAFANSGNRRMHERCSHEGHKRASKK